MREAIARHLSDPAAPARFLADPTADKIDALARQLVELVAVTRAEASPGTLLDLVERIDLAPGELSLRLSGERMATALGLAQGKIAPSALALRLPFRARKRGVETRLILGVAPEPAAVDRTLLVNIAKARRWFARLTSGETYEAIARAEGVSKDRAQKLIDLALLSPRIVERVIQGTQPPGLTTEYLIRTPLPADWAEQERRVARLG